MPEPPFQFSIQFPENINPNEEEDEQNTFEIIHKSEAEDRKPVVVLLGWAGCKEKHLAKYSHMYEKKGYITVKVKVPVSTLYFQAHKLSQVAQELIDVLSKNNISGNPIIFHIFSNGGSMVYSKLTTLLNTADCEYYNKLCVRGVIFDSAPGKRRILNAVKAFIAMLPFGVVLRYLLGLCLLMYLTVSRILLYLLPVGLGSETGFLVYDIIAADPIQCPQLFVYSKADHVILAEDVEEIMAARKEKGVAVHSMCWEDSAHVAHLPAHPEVYTKTCMDFVTACLASTTTAKL